MGFDPVLVDLDGESANESQSTLLVGEDANDMGAALNHMIESLKHVGAFEMLVMFSRQPIESESFFNVLFYPRAETRILLLPAQQPGGDHRLTPSFSHRLTQIHADNRRARAEEAKNSGSSRGAGKIGPQGDFRTAVQM
jgi:hypothetical protein